jgi:hypothetical protein
MQPGWPRYKADSLANGTRSLEIPESAKLGAMGTLSRDTDHEAERVLVEIMKALPAWKKLALLDDACSTSRALALAGLRARHPQASEAALHRMLMGLMLGEEVAPVWVPFDEPV